MSLFNDRLDAATQRVRKSGGFFSIELSVGSDSSVSFLISCEYELGPSFTVCDDITNRDLGINSITDENIDCPLQMGMDILEARRDATLKKLKTKE